MLSEKSKLAQQFELEIWLYLDNELDDERMNYWNDQLEHSAELRNILNETKQVLNVYDSEALQDIDDPTFEAMINKASVKRHGFLEMLWRLLGFTGSENESVYNTSKLAFGSLLVIAGLVMFLISEKPNQVKNLSSDLLDWDADTINKQIDEINGGLSYIEDDRLQQYMLYNATKDEWSRDVFRIEKQIEKLIEKTDKKSL